MHVREILREIRDKLLSSDKFFYGYDLLHPYIDFVLNGRSRNKSLFEIAEKSNDPIIADFKDFKMLIDRNSLQDLEFLDCAVNSKFYEQETTEIISKSIRTGMTFVDIGANSGYFSLLVSSILGTAGKIFAIEPTPSTYERMVKNIQYNNFKNIKPYNVALSEKSGFSYIFVDPVSDGSNSLVENQNRRKYKVTLSTLDDIMLPSLPDLVKIDVEGFEYEVLKGASKTILENEKVRLIIEQNRHWLRVRKQGYDNVINLLRENGFKIFEIQKIGGLSKSEIISHKQLDKYGSNLYCYK